MDDNWAALYLTVIYPKDLTPEQAMELIFTGRSSKTEEWKDHRVLQMISMREAGATWKEIGQVFGITDKSAYAAVKRWKNRRSTP